MVGPGRMHKSQFVNIITPRGAARYPKISEPDTVGAFADGQYKTEIVLTKTDTVAFQQTLHDVSRKLLPHVKSPLLPIRTAKDGTVSFIFRAKRRPIVVDAYKVCIDKDLEIGDGSVI